MSGRKPGGTSKAVEARLSAAMAIYASAGPVSDDDYFTDDGRLDHDKIVSPRNINSNGNIRANPPAMNGAQSPTSAGNAKLTGAAPPPTLGEIESAVLSPPNNNMASPSPGARGSNRMRPSPESSRSGGGSGRKAKFFDESFDHSFSADNADAFNTSVDNGNSGTNKRAAVAASSAERKANRGTAGDSKGALHDPFGAMPSLPTPTSPSEFTSVAARRRARAAAHGHLSVDTDLRSPTAANNSSDATSPATMLDFALQGKPTPAANGTTNAAGYISSDDDEREGVLGAVASPKSWKGGASASAAARRKLDINTSREGLIGADELSPTNAPTVRSDAEARLEEERERREAEEKKNRFLSKMIMRVSCNKQKGDYIHARAWDYLIAFFCFPPYDILSRKHCLHFFAIRRARRKRSWPLRQVWRRPCPSRIRRLGRTCRRSPKRPLKLPPRRRPVQWLLIGVTWWIPTRWRTIRRWILSMPMIPATRRTI